jgi:hypothetical protein
VGVPCFAHPGNYLDDMQEQNMTTLTTPKLTDNFSRIESEQKSRRSSIIVGQGKSNGFRTGYRGKTRTVSAR